MLGVALFRQQVTRDTDGEIVPNGGGTSSTRGSFDDRSRVAFRIRCTDIGSKLADLRIGKLINFFYPTLSIHRHPNNHHHCLQLCDPPEFQSQ